MICINEKMMEQTVRSIELSERQEKAKKRFAVSIKQQTNISSVRIILV